MKTTQIYTAREFAAAMGVSYRTVMDWLKAGLIPGAIKRESPIEWWEIPAKAVKMKKPRRGPKPKKAASAKGGGT